jgi:uncharacterized protein (TIGR01244 family)
MKMKPSRAGVVAVLFVAAASVAAQNDPSSINNFLRVNQQICTGGQPTPEQLEILKAQGVKAIINLRVPSEHDAAAEEAQAKKLGLRYVNIPVDGRALTDEMADKFRKAMREKENRPAFIHCGSANRVGAFWMIYRVLEDGWTLEKAEEEAKKIGMRSAALRDFALVYIDKNKK